MSRFKRHGLPPDSQPWSREVEDRISALETDLESLRSFQTNTNKGVSSTLTQMASQINILEETTATLGATVSDIESRVTVTNRGSTVDTGGLTQDGTTRYFGDDINVTVTVPAGKKITLTVGCGRAMLGGTSFTVIGSLMAAATFKISGGVASYMTQFAGASLYLNSGDGTPGMGTSLSGTYTFDVTPGTYTVTGKMSASSSGFSFSSVVFFDPFLTVSVTG